MKRRNFIQQLGCAGIALASERVYAFNSIGSSKGKKIKIGWITDVHHGYCADATGRLQQFIHQAKKQQPDFILQGGDFCHPTSEAEEFLAVWNQFEGDKYHVLGNHDMDKGSKSDIMRKWGMQAPYYSFVKGAFQFIVLDCNHILRDGKFVPYEKANFYIDSKNRDLVDPVQIQWLEETLEKSDRPCVIISHQSLDEVWTGYTVPNRLEVRAVLETANRKAGYNKVIACFCGHHHLDHHMVIEGIHYIHINSASYYYVGDGFGSDGAKAMYSDPLYCFVSLDPAGTITIEGRKGVFLSPTPADKKYPNAEKLTAGIENSRWRF